MFVLYGKVVGITDSKIGQKNTPVRQLDIMVGEKGKHLHRVKDFNLGNYTEGQEVELPVFVKAYTGKNGAGLDITVVKQK